MKTNRRVGESIVAIGADEDVGRAVAQALDHVSLGRVLWPGDTVMVKASLTTMKGYRRAAITKPAALRAVIRAVRAWNPGRIIVAESSGHLPAPDMLAFSGAGEVIAEEGVDFLNLSDPPFVDASIDHSHPSKVVLNQAVDSVSVLISLAVLKDHEEATISACMKNTALGMPAGPVYGLPKADTSGVPRQGRLDLHADLHGLIVAMNKLLPIDLAILDCSEVMIGSGPTEGKVARAGMALAGTDAVAVDATGARLMGLKPQGVHYLWQAAGQGLGQVAIENIEYRGLHFEDAARRFTKRVFGKEFVLT